MKDKKEFADLISKLLVQNQCDKEEIIDKPSVLPDQDIDEKSKEIQGNYSNCVDHKKVISMNKKGLTQSKIAKELN